MLCVGMLFGSVLVVELTNIHRVLFFGRAAGYFSRRVERHGAVAADGEGTRSSRAATGSFEISTGI